MISDSLLVFIRKTFVVCNLSQISPFEWPKSLPVAQPVTENVKVALWQLNASLTLINCAFVALQWGRVVADSENDVARKVYICFPLVMHTIGGTIQVWGHYNRFSCPSFVRRYVRFYQSEEVSSIPSEAEVRKFEMQCKIFLVLLKHAIMLVPVAIGCMTVISPSLPDFWCSLLQDVDSYNIFWRILFGVLQYYLTLQTCGNIVICTFLGFPPLFHTFRLLEVMRNRLQAGLTSYHNEAQDERRIFHLVSLYRRLSIFVKEYNQVAVPLVICAKFTTLTIVMLCTYGAVRMGGLLAIRLAVIALCFEIYLIVFLMLCGTVHNRSQQFRRVMTARVAEFRVEQAGPKEKYGLWLQKTMRSYKELFIRVGSAYYIDQPIVLTTFKMNLDNTINFLLLQH